MSKRFLSGINVTGTATLNTVANAGLDTDKFLVLDAAGNIEFRTGAELRLDIGADVVSKVQHEVKLGETMTIGTPVYVPISQDSGTNMTVLKASNAGESTSSKTMGLIASSGITNDLVQVITEGLLAGLNTGSATKGDPVWLGVDGALIFGLANKPVAPAHLVFLGIVTRAQTNNGEIFVKVQNGFEMNELHNYAEGSVQNNEVIVYESATSLYKPKTIPTILGYTPVPDSRTLTINGTTYDLSADRSWTISANLNARTEYEFTTDGTTATYSAVYSVGQVDVFYNGSKLASSEFTATNGTSVTLGFTPPSGQIVEVVAWETGGGVASGRTLTINGTAYDLSANRSWTLTTSNISEGTNLYFTNARAQSAVSGIYLPLSGGTLTGALSGTSATFSGAYGTSNGVYLSGTTYGTYGANRGATSASAGMGYFSVGTQKWFAGIYENSDNFGFYSVALNAFPLTLNYSTGAAIFNGSAQSILSVASNNAGGTVFSIENTSTGGGIWRNYSTGSGNGEGAGHLLWTYNAGPPLVIFKNNGNIGINTISPTGQSSDNIALHIHGSGTGNRAQVHFSNTQTGSSSSDGSFIGIDSSMSMYIVQKENADIVLEAGGAERFRIKSSGGQQTKQDLTYGHSEVISANSSFDNPTITVLTVNASQTYYTVMIKVTVIHNGVSGANTNYSVYSNGFAQYTIKADGSVVSTVTSMTVESGINTSNVGTLSWSGNNLRYTANRVTNYDAYLIKVEYGSNFNVNESPTLYN